MSNTINTTRPVIKINAAGRFLAVTAALDGPNGPDLLEITVIPGDRSSEYAPDGQPDCLQIVGEGLALFPGLGGVERALREFDTRTPGAVRVLKRARCTI